MVMQLASHQVTSNRESNCERDSLDNSEELLLMEELVKSDFASWAAYCASKGDDTDTRVMTWQANRDMTWL